MSHLKAGKSPQEAAEALFVGAPTVKRCKQNFIAQGLAGLEDKPRSGRPTRLDSRHHETLKTLIEASHDNVAGGRLTGQDIADIIYQKWPVRYTVNGVYERLKSLGMSWISSRSKHPKQDPQRQEAFKKTWSKKP